MKDTGGMGKRTLGRDGETQNFEAKKRSNDSDHKRKNSL
jgi:hypothetical protein